MDILDIFEPHSSWIKLNEKDYAINSVTQANGAVLLVSYLVGKLYGKANTVTLYNYGKVNGFFKELEQSYEELQADVDEQKVYGIFPIYWESFGKDKMLSVIKLVNAPSVCVVDLFFGHNQNVYGFHTYISSDEKELKLNELCAKYPNIRYIVDEINKFQD